MEVRCIALRRFRNYELAEASLSPGINVISGKNAQGKTNLLESVYLLSCGRSFRTRFDREMIAFDSNMAEISAGVLSENREQTLKMTLRRGQKKQIVRNGAKIPALELSRSLRTVLFCPDDLGMIKQGAAERRRLMDSAIAQLRPGYARLLSDYNRLYENKLRILRDYASDRAMLSSLDDFSDGLCRVSAQMIRYRYSFSRRLEEKAAKICSDFSGYGERLGIRYVTVSTVTDPSAPAGQIYEQLLEHFKNHREAEIASGTCLTGAHKDDLEISINGSSARSFASQGQTRTAALSVKLAEREIFLEETGEYPVLLLDDVLSELDPARQEFVLNRIGGGQTLITCCEDEKIIERTGGRVIFISDGKIIQNAPFVPKQEV